MNDYDIFAWSDLSFVARMIGCLRISLAVGLTQSELTDQELDKVAGGGVTTHVPTVRKPTVRVPNIRVPTVNIH